ncbi:MAG: glycosyltransferase [Verrucomicrobiota bacterium]
MSRICLYFKHPPDADRWIPGDRYLRPHIRRLIRGKRRPSGLERVFLNLKHSLDVLNIPYEENLPFHKLDADDRPVVLGFGRSCLEGYHQPNKIVAGIGLMAHPCQWPTLLEDYPVVRYLQHSEWAAAMYRPHFGSAVDVWPAGIDTDTWKPNPKIESNLDLLIYDKVHWERDSIGTKLLNTIYNYLDDKGLSHKTIRYGFYKPSAYKELLGSCKAMIYLSEHESQGFACQQALSCNVPVLAWNPGYLQDPERFEWGESEVPASTVPYWDSICGMTFKSSKDLDETLPKFWNAVTTNKFHPRDYILDNLTLASSGNQMLKILDSAFGS